MVAAFVPGRELSPETRAARTLQHPQLTGNTLLTFEPPVCGIRSSQPGLTGPDFGPVKQAHCNKPPKCGRSSGTGRGVEAAGGLRCGLGGAWTAGRGLLVETWT